MKGIDNKIDESREQLRELQEMLFDEDVKPKDLFQITVKLDNLLDAASVEYNKYLNEVVRN